MVTSWHFEIIVLVLYMHRLFDFPRLKSLMWGRANGRMPSMANNSGIGAVCIQDNVALIVVLESVAAMADRQKQLICVANTHIHSNPEHSDVKLWQVHTLLKGLEKIAARWGWCEL